MNSCLQDLSLVYLPPPWITHEYLEGLVRREGKKGDLGAFLLFQCHVNTKRK